MRCHTYDICRDVAPDLAVPSRGQSDDKTPFDGCAARVRCAIAPSRVRTVAPGSRRPARALAGAAGGPASREQHPAVRTGERHLGRQLAQRERNVRRIPRHAGCRTAPAAALGTGPRVTGRQDHLPGARSTGRPAPGMGTRRATGAQRPGAHKDLLRDGPAREGRSRDGPALSITAVERPGPQRHRRRTPRPRDRMARPRGDGTPDVAVRRISRPCGRRGTPRSSAVRRRWSRAR
jgi:hypothetical protein